MENQSVSTEAVRLDWPSPAVARITLVRGAELNTLTFEAIEALDRAIDEARENAARVVIVTGEGRAFCAGAHVSYFTEPASELFDNPGGVRDRYVKAIVAAFRKLRDAPFATIAAINGFALGGGCELALCCDFRLMAWKAKIGLTEARLGAVPGASGLQLLSRIVGRARAMQVILLADQWTADQALAAGLVTSAHHESDLAEAALSLARRLLLCSPIAVAAAKAAILGCETALPDVADEIALDAVRHVAAGADWREGMAAFREKRPPAFAVGMEKKP